MTEMMREAQLLRTFATLADTLVDDYDLVDLLQTLVDTCRDVLDMSAAGILLADEHGELELVASTSEASRLVEMMQLSAAAGPCIESFHSGRRVAVAEIADGPDAWARFRVSALEQGFHAVDALPMRLRNHTIGTLNLLRTSAGLAPEEDIVAAQAFADVATIGILHERSLRESAVLAEQLQNALNSRVIIEQAKGVISQVRGVPIEEAFQLMRDYARSRGLGLSVVATRIVDRELDF
ncbi:MAG: GAF and ANTAR domain-containing protein [Microbacterium pygmaeum]